MLLQWIRADFLKTKGLSLRPAHILVPIGAAGVFTAYFAFAPWSAYGKAEAYYQVLAMALPVLMGVFCAMLAEQEHRAGAFQSMLMVEKKCVPLLSKLTVLLLLEAGALVLASLLFYLGFHVLLGNDPVPAGFYGLVPMVLLAGSVVPYSLHLMLAFQLGGGVSMGLGIVESLVSALFLTDMGKYAWKFVPAAWPARLATGFLAAYTGNETAAETLHTMLPVCAVASLAAVVLLTVCSLRWEGTKNLE